MSESLEKCIKFATAIFENVLNFMEIGQNTFENLISTQLRDFFSPRVQPKFHRTFD